MYGFTVDDRLVFSRRKVRTPVLVVVVGNPHPSICKNSMRESGAETILSDLSEKGEKSMEVLVLEIKATILHFVAILSGAKPYLVQEQRFA